METEQAAGPRAGVVHADAAAANDGQGGGTDWFYEEEGISEEIGSIEGAIDVEGPAEQAGAAGIAGQVADGFEGTKENGCAVALGFGHHVQAMVEAVDEVHVGMARGTEHRAVPGGETAGRVGSAVMGAEVGLGFDNAADSEGAMDGPDDPVSEEVTGDLGGVALEEGAGQAAEGEWGGGNAGREWVGNRVGIRINGPGRFRWQLRG